MRFALQSWFVLEFLLLLCQHLTRKPNGNGNELERTNNTDLYDGQTENNTHKRKKKLIDTHAHTYRWRYINSGGCLDVFLLLMLTYLYKERKYWGIPSSADCDWGKSGVWKHSMNHFFAKKTRTYKYSNECILNWLAFFPSVVPV